MFRSKICVTLMILFGWQGLSSVAFAQTQVMDLTSSAPYTVGELNTIKRYLLENIATDKKTFSKKDQSKMIHSIPGAVLASPSNHGEGFSQDYQFHWVRDAAITMREVVELYKQASDEDKKHLKQMLINYVNFERKAQKQLSKKGEQTLGQPKYNIDGTVWEGKWGRPQNDGPALRARTLIAIAEVFAEDKKFVKDTLVPMIVIDLNYVASQWGNPTYDLWEEVSDRDHFFTNNVQRKALSEGAAFLNQNGQPERAKTYTEASDKISASMEKYWHTDRGYLSETLHQQDHKGGGLDSSILLGVLYGEIDNKDDVLAPSNDKVLSSIAYLRRSFANLYKINTERPRSFPLIGRYPTDIYDGYQFENGNPWVLTTNALAQYYYLLAKTYLKQNQIVLTTENIPFFEQIDAGLILTEETVSPTDNPEVFFALVNGLIQAGDKALQTVKQYSTCENEKSCLHFAEQIDRVHGKPMSAKDLTWGYASLLAAMQERAKIAEVNKN